MYKYDISKLKRNPEVVKSYFKVNETNTLVNKKVYVMFPARFIKRELAILTNTYVRLVGIYCIIDDEGNYAVSNSPIQQNLLPLGIETVEVNKVEYYLLTFEANTVFMMNNKLIVNNNFVYDIFDEFFSKGKIPWYLDYEDVAVIFADGKNLADVTIGNDPFLFEVLTAIISRQAEDKTKYFRSNPKGNLSYTGLNDIRYGFDNTGSRLIGGYFKEGIVTSLVDPETTTTKSSTLLRQ